MLLQLSYFPPFSPLHPAHTLLHAFPPFSSCPWVIDISSLASTFPILFLPSPCLFSTYHLRYLFSVHFPLLSPSHSPVDNPPSDLHSWGSVPGSSCFLSLLLFLGVVFNNCEFAVTFTVHIFYLLFLRQIPLRFHIIRAWWWWTLWTWPYLRSTLSSLPF